MQEVYSNTSKVLVTGDKGQNNLLYLPLDKMANASAGTASAAAGNAVSPDIGARISQEVQQRELRVREAR